MAKKARAEKSKPKTTKAKAAPVKTDDAGAVVVFEFIGNEGEHMVGVPARDITLEDYDRLEGDFKAKVGPKWDVHANADSDRAIYRRLMTVTEARKAQSKVEAGASERASKAAKSVRAAPVATQVDPDTRTPGRIDSDTLAPGIAVPATDEPLAENAPGFVQSDTGGAQTPG